MGVTNVGAYTYVGIDTVKFDAFFVKVLKTNCTAFCKKSGIALSNMLRAKKNKCLTIKTLYRISDISGVPIEDMAFIEDKALTQALKFFPQSALDAKKMGFVIQDIRELMAKKVSDADKMYEIMTGKYGTYDYLLKEKKGEEKDIPVEPEVQEYEIKPLSNVEIIRVICALHDAGYYEDEIERIEILLRR